MLIILPQIEHITLQGIHATCMRRKRQPSIVNYPLTSGAFVGSQPEVESVEALIMLDSRFIKLQSDEPPSAEVAVEQRRWSRSLQPSCTLSSNLGILLMFHIVFVVVPVGPATTRVHKYVCEHRAGPATALSAGVLAPASAIESTEPFVVKGRQTLSVRVPTCGRDLCFRVEESDGHIL